MKKLIIIVFVTCVTGCASHYIPPSSGLTARLSFPAFTAAYKFMKGFSTAAVNIAVAEGGKCGEFTRSIKPQHNEKFVEVVIPAEKKIFVRAEYTVGNTVCSVSGSFVAKSEFTYLVNPSFKDNRCVLAVNGGDDEDNRQPVRIEKVFVDHKVGLKVCSKKEYL